MATSPAISRQKPRLSAAQLADYVAATSTLAQLAILRQAKFPGPSKPIIIQYQIVRRGIAACLTSQSTGARELAQTQVTLEQRRDDPASSPLVIEDAKRSLEVLSGFERQRNSFDFGATRLETAERKASMNINGVEISVQADAICIAMSRQGPRVGQLFIRCAAGSSGEAADNRRAEANQHLATIAHIHSIESLQDSGQPHAPTSMVLDIPRGKLVKGSSSSINRVKNIEATCGVIAALWPTITER